MRSWASWVLLSSIFWGCGGGISPARPTETVRVLGTSTDAIGRTVEVDPRGFVHVALHEGPDVWVPAASVSPAAMTAGAAIVARDAAGALFAATIVTDLDSVVVVRRDDGTRELVPLERVLAVLHVGVAVRSESSVSVVNPDTPPPPPPPPPPPDPRRFATMDTTTELFERVRVASCSAAGARILTGDGTVVTVPVRDVRATRVRAGDHVAALWQDGETAYAGVVLAIEGRLARIRYDDGSEEWVQPEQIVRREARAGTEAGACPRGGQEFAMVRRGALRRVVELVSCAGSVAVVHTPGGEASEQVSLTDLRALAVPPGGRIEVFWHQSAPYTGWATASGDGTVEVRYDDGSVESSPVTDVRWIASDFVAEPFLCPPG